MRWALVALVLLAAPVRADDRLDAAGITAALTDKALAYEDGTTQSFKADGETIFTNGKDSIGHWRVAGGRYCSVWPPSDTWACYDVMRTGTKISFVADDGSSITGKFAP